MQFAVYILLQTTSCFMSPFTRGSEKGFTQIAFFFSTTPLYLPFQGEQIKEKILKHKWRNKT